MIKNIWEVTVIVVHFNLSSTLPVLGLLYNPIACTKKHIMPAQKCGTKHAADPSPSRLNVAQIESNVVLV